MTIMDVVRAGEALAATGAACVALAVWRLPDVADLLAGSLRRGAAWLALRLNARAEALRRSRTVYAEVYRHVIDGYALDRISLHWDGTREVKVVPCAPEPLQPAVRLTLDEAVRISRRVGDDDDDETDPASSWRPVHGPEYHPEYDPTRGPDPAEEGRTE